MSYHIAFVGSWLLLAANVALRTDVGESIWATKLLKDFLGAYAQMSVPGIELRNPLWLSVIPCDAHS